jgi:hypothetical protein
VFFTVSSRLTSIRKHPITNMVLAKNRVDPLLNFGNAAWSKPKKTKNAPTETNMTGSPMRKFPKKYKPAPMRTAEAPTNIPEQVAQNFLPPICKT